ncbi:MAG: hypothetical protein FWC79_07810 [Oscillospiraceae bacterium]|nr:hypothetical protein [Oscillospiraceae bacterium]
MHIAEIENRHNLALYEAIHHMQKINSYLHEMVTLDVEEYNEDVFTNMWREANLARVYLARVTVYKPWTSEMQKVF